MTARRRYRHVIVTGGSSGIGLAVAQAVSPRADALTLVARRAEPLAEAARLLSGAGAAVAARSADVADAAALAAALAAAVEERGPADLVVAAAGRVSVGRFADLDGAAFDADMAVNYFGVLNTVRGLLAPGRLAAGARLVLVSSGTGLVGVPGYGAYAPSKFAVRGLAEVLRLELAPRGIGVTVVYPPDTETPQLAAERPLRPPETAAVAGAAPALSAAAVAAAIVRGAERGRFIVAPGAKMTLLAALHSLIHPFWRAWCDRRLRRLAR
ncbi:MAG: SDR family NAD(P)-dependent oxidoreductase [Rhodospirillaceae bacterium]